MYVQTTKEEGYLSGEARWQREFDGLVPLPEEYGVTVGVQNHSDWSVANAAGLRSLRPKYDPHHIAAVWDTAREALEGGLPEPAIDTIRPHASMVNLKNAHLAANEWARDGVCRVGEVSDQRPTWSGCTASRR